MATVVATARSEKHNFTKQKTPSITLLKGLGIEGDAHAGKNVQHRSRLHIKPPPANLRQVHLIQEEVLNQYELTPAEIGENITTRGVDLLNLGTGTQLHFVPKEVAEDIALGQEHPVITITGLRNPCPQIEKYRKGLQEKFIVRDAERRIVERKAGVMSTVDVGGVVMPGMKIVVQAPKEHQALGCV